MSKVISDALQQIVRASQLGDVIVSNKRPLMPVTALFTVILNIDVATITPAVLVALRTNTLQTFNQNNAPSITSAASFTSGLDFTVDATPASFPLEAVPAGALQAPDQEDFLSNMGSFPALESTPSFDVT